LDEIPSNVWECLFDLSLKLPKELFKNLIPQTVTGCHTVFRLEFKRCFATEIGMEPGELRLIDNPI
jgi:hypothetical protein